jgi:hypothetical protein
MVAIVVCDDSGIVIVHKELHHQESWDPWSGLRNRKISGTSVSTRESGSHLKPFV